MTDEELIKRLRSQVGDDVQQVYDHEALFRLSADRIEALVKGRDDAVIKRAAWELEAKTQQARAERLEAALRDAGDALRLSSALITLREPQTGVEVAAMEAALAALPAVTQPAPDAEAIREALLSLPAVYAHQINTGVREVYDPLQRFYLMEDVLRALITEKPHDRA